MRGRKPTPTSVKMLAGNPGKRALNHHEPKPAAGHTRLPDRTEPGGQGGIGSPGHRAGAAPHADQPGSCGTRRLLRVLRPPGRCHGGGAQVRHHGEITFRLPDAVTCVAIANKQVEIMLRIAAKFGFTPASRSRVAVPPEREPDLFDFNNDVIGEG